ncbi:hypothetical protein MRX96_035670 [Rhipicephalus microplus]
MEHRPKPKPLLALKPASHPCLPFARKSPIRSCAAKSYRPHSWMAAYRSRSLVCLLIREYPANNSYCMYIRRDFCLARLDAFVISEKTVRREATQGSRAE